MKRFFWLLPLILGIAAAGYLFLAPTVGEAGSGAMLSSGGSEVAGGPAFWSRSLLATQGLSVVPTLLAPVVLTVLPLLAGDARLRWGLEVIGAILLGLFCVLGIMTVGLFYVPSLMALVLALIVGWTKSGSKAAV